MLLFGKVLSTDKAFSSVQVLIDLFDCGIRKRDSASGPLQTGRCPTV